jgi:hypothetical protein
MEPRERRDVFTGNRKEPDMVDTTTLTDREEIRNWAAARGGMPALREADPAVHNEAVLRIVFGQENYQDQDMPPRPDSTQAGFDFLDWDEWLRIFDERELALVVAVDPPGRHSKFYEIVRRE